MALTLDQLLELRSNPNVRAALDVISKAEGTATHGYATAFGGGRLDTLADHPRQFHEFTETTGRRNRTSAAGRYQFLSRTWDSLAARYGFQDFGEVNQDVGAIALLEENGALPSILAGDVAGGLEKAGGTWASLPSSPYAQPRRSNEFLAAAVAEATGQPTVPTQVPEATIPPSEFGTLLGFDTTSDPLIAQRASILDESMLPPTGGQLLDIMSGPTSRPEDVSGDALRREAARAAELSWLDTLGAAAQETAISGIWRALGRPSFAPDPDFNVESWMEENKELLQQRGAPEFFAHARSLAETAWMKERWDDQQQREYILSNSSTLGSFTAFTVTTAIDPTSWAAGIGGMAMAARIAKGTMGRAVIGGAAGNVAYDAARAAFGADMSSEELFASAAFGAGLGGLLGGFGPSAGQQARATSALQRAAALRQARLREVANELGPGATPAEVLRETKKREFEQEVEPVRRLLQALPEDERILPSGLDGDVTVEAARASIRQEIGLDAPRFSMEGITSSAQEASWINLTIDASMRFVRRHGAEINEDRLRSLFPAGAIRDNMQSFASTLLRDGSPVSKMLAARLLENPTGAFRGRTAAIQKSVLENVFLGDVKPVFEAEFTTWRAAQGRRNPTQYFKDMEAFKLEVYRYIEHQRQGIRPTAGGQLGPAPSVRRAAQALEQAHERMRVAMVEARVAGAENLMRSTARGYTPWRVSHAKWTSLSPGQQRAYAQLLAEQAESVAGLSPEAALTWANVWINNQIIARANSNQPVHLMPGGNQLDRMEAALREANIPDAQREEIMRQWGNAGPRQTRGRMARDLFAKKETGRRLPDGSIETISLMDIMDTDPLAGVIQAARTSSGQVSLAQYGLAGNREIEVMRKAMRASGATQQALDAFDGAMAELLGRPIGDRMPVAAQVLTGLTALRSLGGVVWAQAQEVGNQITALGVMGFLRGVPGLGRAWREAGAIARGEMKVSDSPFLAGMERYTGHIGQEGYRNNGPWGVFGGLEAPTGPAETPYLLRIVRMGQHIQSVMTGFRRLHAAQMRHTAEQAGNLGLEYLAGTVTSAARQRALRDMGITPSLEARMRAELPRIVRFGDDGKVMEYTPQNAIDAYAVQEYHQAIVRGTNQIIQGTFAGEVGHWAHKPWLQVATQFRSYSITSLEKQFIRGWKTHGAAITGFYALAAGALVTAPIYMARVMSGAALLDRDAKEDYLETRLNPAAFARGILTYTAQTGFLADVADVTGTLVGGNFTGAVGNFLGLEEVNPRTGGGRDFVSTVVPSVATVNDTVRALQRIADPTKEGFSLSPAATVIPFGRAPQFLPLFEALLKND